MRHTRYGYWLEEAGPVEPTRPLGGRHDGRRGRRRRRLPRPLDGVAAEGARAGARRRRARCRPRGARAERTQRRLRLDALGRPAHPARQRRRRPRGRGMPCLRACRARDRRVLRRAGGRRALPGRRHDPGRDEAPRSSGTGTSSSRCARRSGHPPRPQPLSQDQVAARCASRLPRRGLLLPTAANVQPALLSLGLRAKVIEAGVRLHERTRRSEALGRRRARRPARERCAPTRRSWP